MTTNRQSRARTGLALLTGLVLVGCGSDSVAPGTHNEVLDRLGVKTALPPINGADGKPVSADYNPLSRKRRTLSPLHEIYMAGPAAATGARETLRGDITEGWAVLDMGTRDSDWGLYPKVSTKGDFDGDGHGEVAVLYLDNDKTSSEYKSLYLRVVEDKAEAWTAQQVWVGSLTDAELTELAADPAAYYLKLDIAAGDLDGDGKDEIFATAAGNLWVLDDGEASPSFGVLLAQRFSRGESVVSQFLRVGAGDADGDGKAEMVVADGQLTSASSGSVTYYIYDGLEKTTSGQVKVEGSTTVTELMTADVALGDVDGDRLDELVFSGRQSGAPTDHRVLVMDDAKAGYVFMPVEYKYTPTYPAELLLHRVETGDFDGDGVAEIVSYNQILDDLKTHKGLELVTSLPGAPASASVLAVGDVTNDLKDDIVYLRRTAADTQVVVFGAEPGNTYAQLQTIDVQDSPPYMTLTTVDTDDDSALVEFLSHELRFSDPRILAVLAAPPSYKDIDTDNTLAGTSFGKLTSEGIDFTQSVGFHVGFSVTLEGEAMLEPGVTASASLTTSLTASFDLTTTKSLKIDKALYYTGTADSDKVVFTAVPFDVYYYKILASPRKEEVGKKVAVNIPREPETLFVDREFFNANNGNFPDIDSRVLGHTIGDPRTYPRESSLDKSALAKFGFHSPRMTVGEGMGYQMATISPSVTDSVGLGFDLAVDVSIQAGLQVGVESVGAVSAEEGPEFGFHYGFSYTLSSGTASYYSGSVGNIKDGGDWANNRFNFGLFVQPITFQGQKFPVINYWVD